MDIQIKVYLDPAWGITFIGFEFGSKNLHAMIDINIGQATLFAAGIGYRW